MKINLNKICSTLSLALLLVVFSLGLNVNKASALSSSIIEYWNFTGSSNLGGVSTDDVMTLSNGYTGGKYGTGVDLNYYNGAAISGDMSHSTSATLTDGFTACFWSRASQGNDNRMEVNFGTFGGGFTVGPNNFSINSPTGNSTQTYNAWNSAGINDGSWNQLCYVASLTETKFYYNGVGVYSATDIGTPNFNVAASSINIRAGNWTDHVDDVVVFNKPLTTSQIQDVYANEMTSSYVLPDPLPVCTGYTYNNLGPCKMDGTRTRDVASSIPGICADGLSPVLHESCTYSPPATGFAVDDRPITNGYVSVPVHTANSILLCEALCFYGCGADQMKLDDVPMTQLFGFGDGRYVFYEKNPLQGSRTIWTNSGLGQGVISCTFIEGVDKDTPITTTLGGGGQQWDVHEKSYPNAGYDNLVIAFTSYRGSLVVTSPNSTIISQRVGTQYMGGSYFGSEAYRVSDGSGLDTFNINTFSGWSQYSDWYFLELNAVAPLPPCESYNFSSWGNCDETGRQFRTIFSSNPTACNYTDVQSAAPVLGQDCVYTAPVYPDVSLPFTIISPFTFSFNSTAKVNYTYDTNAFTPYDYIEVRQVSSDWATSTFISTSSPVANDFLHDGHSYFLLPGNPEIRGRYNYEVTGYFAPYYLPGVGDVPAASSIPAVFSVYWRETEVPTAQDIIDYEHTLSTEFSHGVLYETSCTNEEWATPDPQVNFGFGVWTFPALNMTRLHCAAELAAMELGTAVIDKMTGYFTKVSNMLKNVFPFNIYSNLSESWINSKYTEVLPELSFLSPVNGNLSVQIPNGTVGSSTSFVLWGSGIFTSPTTLGADNANKASQLFGAIRTIIKWALWGLFGFWVVRNGQAFVRKMTGGE